MTDFSRMTWEQSLQELQRQSDLMDEIHEAHPGKENRMVREMLLRPHRAVCVSIHYHRSQMARVSRASAPAGDGKINLKEFAPTSEAVRKKVDEEFRQFVLNDGFGAMKRIGLTPPQELVAQKISTVHNPATGSA